MLITAKFLLYFKVLRTSLKWLNEWELNWDNNLIREDQFLTHNTADGLRMTIASTLDIVEYLHEGCDFSYVLTGKMNQDCLEVRNKKLYYVFCSLFRQFKNYNSRNVLVL